jgi:hypothetical protein
MLCHVVNPQVKARRLSQVTSTAGSCLLGSLSELSQGVAALCCQQAASPYTSARPQQRAELLERSAGVVFDQDPAHAEVFGDVEVGL